MDDKGPHTPNGCQQGNKALDSQCWQRWGSRAMSWVASMHVVGVVAERGTSRLPITRAIQNERKSWWKRGGEYIGERVVAEKKGEGVSGRLVAEGAIMVYLEWCLCMHGIWGHTGWLMASRWQTLGCACFTIAHPMQCFNRGNLSHTSYLGFLSNICLRS